MRLKGFVHPYFDPYLEGWRHTFIAFTNEPSDGWDIVKYLKNNGFADGIILTTRLAEKVVKLYKDIIERATVIKQGRNVVDTVLNNVLFEWNGRYLFPIRYDPDLGKKYLFAHIIRVYRAR